MDTKHILVVEDEHHLAFGIKYNLEAEGYRVTVHGDGPSALAALEANDPAIDLVVLDLMLPGMSGYAVCEKLRAAGNEIPVLILSARTLSEDRTRGFEVGADQYLNKPFDLDELLSRVKNLLIRFERRTSLREDRPKEVGDVYDFGKTRVNFVTYETVVGGEPLRLTNMEMQLLRFFIDNEGRVLSREVLLEKVWGHETIPTTRTVDNFIMRFRRYFEDDPSHPKHFLSVRGAGYRFVAKPDPGQKSDEEE
ncbi:MAG TPA: response regulator transcription factor [Pirellulales bacterium]